MSPSNDPNPPRLKEMDTVASYFNTWDSFVTAYYEPIREALALLPHVGPDRADDVAIGFFEKLQRRQQLPDRSAIKKQFRDWLYRCAYNYSIDEWRKPANRAESPGGSAIVDPEDTRTAGGDDAPPDTDELYALSILHRTVRRVRKYCRQEGLADHWMIFENLVLAPILPDRPGKTRDELRAMFPGERANFLNERITTVHRVFRRLLPALIPADPTDDRAADERLEELLSILHGSARSRLWLAFLQAPSPDSDGSIGSSIDLAVKTSTGALALAVPTAEGLNNEMRILLCFWLDTPLGEFLEAADAAGPAVSAAVRRAPALRARGRDGVDDEGLHLRMLVDPAVASVASIPCDEIVTLLHQVKSFAKRVHRPRKRRADAFGSGGPITGRFQDSMPFEISQVLYNLAGALALTRCDARIVGLDDAQFRKNLKWALKQSWLDHSLRPIFAEAIARLGSPRTSRSDR